MKTTYRGHEIEVTREESVAGIDLLFYGVFRESDGYECASGFSYGDEGPADFAGRLRARVDAELASTDPWGFLSEARANAWPDSQEPRGG